MSFNNEYKQHIEERLNKILELRKAWLALSTENEELATTREHIYIYGYNPKLLCLNPCPVCGAKKTERKSITEDVSYNGNSHGVYFEWCTGCGQCNKWHWDKH
jgi:hypothetical protein